MSSDQVSGLGDASLKTFEPFAAALAPPPSDLSPLEQCIAYHVPHDEYHERVRRLTERYKDVTVEESGFDTRKQFRCTEQMNEYELSYITNFFQCVEANEWSMAYCLIDKLYKSSVMVNEPKGLLAFVTASVSTFFTPMASVVHHATPFSRVMDDDWAYYVALARVKMDNNQFAHALDFLRLAKLVPHCHPGIVGFAEYEIMQALGKQRYAAPKTIPNFVKHYETVLKTFRDADKIRDSIVKEIPLFEKDPQVLARLREENINLQRVFSRAEARYYINNWQLVDNPEPQPASIWSRLPDSVIAHMACVVNWKEYLQLASTCRLYHNRMNNSRVWQTVLEKKWDLDLTCFDEGIPRNPVVIVQQIHYLFYLNRSWWRQNSGYTAPLFEIPLATERALTAAPFRIFSCTCLSDELPAEVVWRLFMSVIAGDKSGNLTAALIENGILDYVINSIRTESITEHAELGMGVLALLYIRSRRTCALVSRFLPPTVAIQLLMSKTYSGDWKETAFGVMAAVTASHVLFPDAHSMSLPSLVQREGSAYDNIQVTDLSDVLKPRAGDYQAAIVDPSYTSLHRAGYTANDPWDLDPPKELEVDKLRFNLDHREEATGRLEMLPQDAEAAQAREVPLPTVEIGLLRSYQEAYNAGTEYERVKEEEEAMDENPEGPREFDEQHAALLDTNKEAADRFAAADAQWQLFITLPGVATNSNVLHRGLLRMTMDKSTLRFEEDESFDIHGAGYWTIDAEETPETMEENAIFSNGQYDPTFVAHQHESGRESATAKELWKKSHRFELESATISEGGTFTAAIVRDNDTFWTLEGTGFILGYHGIIMQQKSPKRSRGDGDENERDGNDEEDEENGEDNDEEDDEEGTLVGGWMLLKPEFADQSAIGKEDLNAYEQLATVSLRVGPLAFPENAPYPQAWEDSPEDEAIEATVDTKLKDISEHVGMLTAACVNYANFNMIITHDGSEYEAARPPDGIATAAVLRYLFVPDVHLEFAGSVWRHRRFSVAYDYFYGLDLMRSSLTFSCREEAKHDLALMAPFCPPFIASQDAACLCIELPYVVLEAQILAKADDQTWKAAYVAHLKWAARLSLFEIAGLDDIRAMRYTWNVLYNSMDDGYVAAAEEN